MKRCPECRRDYYDDTLAFCLEDGTALMQGSVSAPVQFSDEPMTAILHETAAPDDRVTLHQVHTTGQTTILPPDISSGPKKGLDMRLLFAPLVLVIVLGGFIAYRYLSPAGPIESIAVMPFVNESGNPEVEYLSDGMTETLIKSLSQVPNLSVKSRSTVFFYKGKETSPKSIGDELGVAAVLLGRVSGRGDDLKLSLELVNTQTQDVIWAEQYDRKQSDLVSLQSEIAKDVSTKLQTKLSGAEVANITQTATADPQAYQAYLKGRYYWNRRTAENLKKAIEQFKIATDRDPNYALAFTGLADCFVVLPEYAGTSTSEAVEQVKAFAERAIAIDDKLGEAYASLANANELSWQWAEAERLYKRAIELNPNYATAYHWYSIALRSRGRFDEAALMIRRAQEIDPLSSIIGVNVSLTYQIQNDHNASIENSLKLIELDPNFSGAYQYLGLSYLKLGRESEAIVNLEKAVALSNRAAVRLVDLGHGYGVTGRHAEAKAIAKELEEKYARKQANAVDVAGVYTGLDEKDLAFEWLEKAFQTKEELAVIRFRAPFESLRGDLRYKDLIRRMGLPE